MRGGAIVALVDTFRIVSTVISVLFMIAVIEFIRRNRLKERYAILWLGAGVVLVILSVWGELLVEVTRRLGFDVPLNALSLVIVFFLIVIVFHFSIAISMESERTKRLAQEVALLKERLRRLAPDTPPENSSEP